jgi:hypothetical protein
MPERPLDPARLAADLRAATFDVELESDPFESKRLVAELHLGEDGPIALLHVLVRDRVVHSTRDLRQACDLYCSARDDRELTR